MRLRGLDHEKMTVVIAEGWKALDPVSRERILSHVDEHGGFMHQWKDNGDGTLTVTWAGVELCTVPLWRVMPSPMGRFRSGHDA